MYHTYIFDADLNFPAPAQMSPSSPKYSPTSPASPSSPKYCKLGFLQSNYVCRSRHPSTYLTRLFTSLKVNSVSLPDRTNRSTHTIQLLRTVSLLKYLHTLQPILISFSLAPASPAYSPTSPPWSPSSPAQQNGSSSNTQNRSHAYSTSPSWD